VVVENKTSPARTGIVSADDEKRNLLLSQSTKAKTDIPKEKRVCKIPHIPFVFSGS
jgi:hypothetical protein